MRTTVTLDDDNEAGLRRRMRTRRLTFKEALNDALRSGLADAPASGERFSTAAVDLGVPTVDLDRALQLVGELEDDELIRRTRVGS